MQEILGESKYDDDTGEELATLEDILAVSKAFPDLKDVHASYAIALVLYDTECYAEALPEARNSFEAASSDPIKRLEATDLLANILYSMDRYMEAYDIIKSTLSDTTDIPPTLLRRSLVTRAKIESELSMLEEAAVSYETARHTLPDTPMLGQDLKDQLGFLISNNYDDPTAIINAVKSWIPIERLAWATWEYNIADEQHQAFQRACGRAQETDFMVGVYNEIINFLDAVEAGAPMRLELAYAQWRTRGDLAASKALLDEILETEVDGSDFKLTGQDSSWTMVQTIGFISDIIYEQFRTCSDPVRKTAIVAEMRGVTSRPMSRSVTSWKSMLNHHGHMLARMCKKMGPMVEYQQILQQVFDVCYESLTDDVGWNDRDNLHSMAMVLDIMGGFEKEARTLLSAVFSVVDKAPDADDERDGAEDNTETMTPKDDSDEKDPREEENDKSFNGSGDSADDGSDEDDAGSAGEEASEDGDDDASSTSTLPTDEGDLTGDDNYYCSGECLEDVTYRAWKGRTLYFCTICADISLCEPCFAKRQEYNSGTSYPHATVGGEYCGRSHRYLKCPVEGWKGITNGVMVLEREDGVEFKEWLRVLKEEKWPAAWEAFWMREE